LGLKGGQAHNERRPIHKIEGGREFNGARGSKPETRENSRMWGTQPKMVRGPKGGTPGKGPTTRGGAFTGEERSPNNYSGKRG